jgi:DNA modification methylase
MANSSSVKLLLGDCLETLKTIENNSVDSIVCDPPYGLSFMGKKWDYELPSIETWREILRVLKPGGHALIACGTRTQHRMVVNVEDAGFEIKDVICWHYGSGFPKSMDISKAIDKQAGAEREVVGLSAHSANRKRSVVDTRGDFNSEDKRVITAPSTDEAKQWQGWGTALKPATEFFTLARKPISESTIAKNVLKHGTGGLNIDASRILPNDQRPDKKQVWEKEILLCNSCVELAALNKKHLTQEIKEFTATKNAEQISNENQNGQKQVDTSKTATGCLDEMSTESINTSLNTFTSGNAPMDQSPADISSITSTKTKKTIDSKTCNSCHAEITHAITLQNIRVVKSETQSMQNAQGPSGRWPANVIFSEEAAKVLDEQSGVLKNGGQNSSSPDVEGLFGNRKSGHTKFAGDSGGASRFFYVAKSSKRERNAGLPDIRTEKQGARPNSKDASGKFPDHDHRESGANNHPTVKPLKLMQYLIRMVTPPFVYECENCNGKPHEKNRQTRSDKAAQLSNLSEIVQAEGQQKARKVLLQTMRRQGARKNNSENVPRMREGISARSTKSSGDVLLSEVFDGSDGAPETWTSGDHPKRLSDDLYARTSDGGEQGNDHGTSLDNGKASRSTPDEARSGSPREREQAGQPHREPRNSSKESTRPTSEASGEADSMPALHGDDQGIRTCSDCGKALIKRSGRVLDPFMGSGTTGCAAATLGFNFIGCEMSEEYMAIAEKRIAHAQNQIPDEKLIEEQLDFLADG